MTFREINFSPFANNVLDFVGRNDLVTSAGERVLLSRSGLDFIIAIGYLKWETDDNIEASYILNSCQVGVSGE